jgi:membrane protein implicated in regulation of membrane protease activity
MLEVWHLWVIAGLALFIIEIFTPGFVMGVFGVACLVVAPFAGKRASLNTQLLVFGIATAAMSLGIRPLIIRYLYRRESMNKTNVDALVGRTGLVTEAVDQALNRGRVRLGGEEWRAVTPDESKIEAGTKVIVKAVEGCKVVVETAK